MFELTNHDHVRIYTDTLMALARDARVQGNAEVYRFIAGYLAPFGFLQAELWQETDGASAPREIDGGPKVAPTPTPPAMPPRQATVSVRESESIKW